MKRYYMSIPILFAVSLVLMVLIFALRFNNLPPEIPLFYSLHETNRQVVNILFIFLIPFLSIAMVGVNLFLKKKMFTENDFIIKIINIANGLIIFGLTFIFIKIVLLVS